jgi:hypothetical protein
MYIATSVAAAGFRPRDLRNAGMTLYQLLSYLESFTRKHFIGIILDMMYVPAKCIFANERLASARYKMAQ